MGGHLLQIMIKVHNVRVVVRCGRCASWIASNKPGQNIEKLFLYAKGPLESLTMSANLKKEFGKAPSLPANVLLEEGCQLRVKSLLEKPCEIHEEGTVMA